MGSLRLLLEENSLGSWATAGMMVNVLCPPGQAMVPSGLSTYLGVSVNG